MKGRNHMGTPVTVEVSLTKACDHLSAIFKEYEDRRRREDKPIAWAFFYFFIFMCLVGLLAAIL